jgi:hypothetical protein
MPVWCPWVFDPLREMEAHAAQRDWGGGGLGWGGVGVRERGKGKGKGNTRNVNGTKQCNMFSSNVCIASSIAIAALQHCSIAAFTHNEETCRIDSR